MSRHVLVVCATVFLMAQGAFFRTAQADEQNRFITIGTGGPTGVYYPVGGAICRLINQSRRLHGIRCTVESTAGSLYNIKALHGGDFDFGIAQSDIQADASHGTGPFAQTGAVKDLRAVFSLHVEAFTVLARADAKIIDFDDLKGKRVNIGNPGSGARDAMERVMAAKGWTLNDFAQASELGAGQQGDALCQNQIDATVYSVGHPATTISDTAGACDTVLVDVAGPAIDRLLAENDFYSKTVIPGGLYYGNPDPVTTVCVGSTLMVSAATDPEIVYQLVKTVFENFNAFKRAHPALAALSKEDMVRGPFPVALHEGAQRYYRAAGLLGDGGGQGQIHNQRRSGEERR
ncbi:TAXI family TRAP transporter solute-binding subunit [Thalassospira mesophila]|uniref:TAXI family TRAP transporter solute-binding subunit n=1 Tax=Thalassospira mesophila TaxID=1293891 RepID=UPI000A1FB70E|nr:TAXI family TRAP transporter solute-binding subunit [Thalassospira mesophila]